MPKIAVVTGAGSGVGRASAIRLVKEGWSVAAWLAVAKTHFRGETAALTNDPNRTFVVPCDVADPAAVMKMAGAVLDRFGEVHALVHAAGTNIPQRSWDVLTMEDFRQVIDINLNGAFYCARAFLPTMRRKGGGNMVFIISDAGILAAQRPSDAAYAAQQVRRARAGAIARTSKRKQNGIPRDIARSARAILTRRFWRSVPSPRHPRPGRR